MFSPLMIVAIGVTVVLWRTKGGALAALFIIATTVCIVPTDSITISYSMLNVRSASSTPDIELHSYHIALLATIVMVPRTLSSRCLSVPLIVAPFALLMIATFSNDLPTHVESGILHWAWVALAWAAGAALARERLDGRLTDRSVAGVIALVMAANAAMAALQLLGLRTVSSIDAGTTVIERVSGFQGHSGNLGKVLLLLLVVALPLTRSADLLARRWSIFAALTTFALIGLSYSRANTVAVISALVLWFLLGPGGSAMRRLVVPVLVAVAALPFIDVLLVRNAYDPSGGSRPVLVQAAHEQIGRTLWWGVGPNDYQRTVGSFSPISSGLPVHNSGLLVLTELGLVVAILVALPLVLLATTSILGMRRNGIAGSQAAAVTAVLPGLLVIGATGFGLVFQQILLLLFFAAGHCWQLIREPPSPAAVSRGDAKPARLGDTWGDLPATRRAD